MTAVYHTRSHRISALMGLKNLNTVLGFWGMCFEWLCGCLSQCPRSLRLFCLFTPFPPFPFSLCSVDAWTVVERAEISFPTGITCLFFSIACFVEQKNIGFLGQCPSGQSRLVLNSTPLFSLMSDGTTDVCAIPRHPDLN